MILDGQQRLTSLHYAFAAPDISLRGTKYPYRFFLDLNKVRKGDFEDAITSERSDWCGDYMEEGYQFQKLKRGRRLRHLSYREGNARIVTKSSLRKRNSVTNVEHHNLKR